MADSFAAEQVTLAMVPVCLDLSQSDAERVEILAALQEGSSFRRTGEAACVAVEVPEGGLLEPSGERWRCLRGHIKVDDTCQQIVLPANAYLADASYGSTWTCERGFEATGDLRTGIAVPANAFLNGSGYGQSWTCERGFFDRAGLCEAVAIPANAYFDDTSYGTGWKCDRGYEALGETCEVISVPENVHLDRSGNHWECNKKFQKSKGLCVLKNEARATIPFPFKMHM